MSPVEAESIKYRDASPATGDFYGDAQSLGTAADDGNVNALSLPTPP